MGLDTISGHKNWEVYKYPTTRGSLLEIISKTLVVARGLWNTKYSNESAFITLWVNSFMLQMFCEITL